MPVVRTQSSSATGEVVALVAVAEDDVRERRGGTTADRRERGGRLITGVDLHQAVVGLDRHQPSRLLLAEDPGREVDEQVAAGQCVVGAIEIGEDLVAVIAHTDTSCVRATGSATW
jgi:hypothetical protein